jgi:hypothetical protein
VVESVHVREVNVLHRIQTARNSLKEHVEPGHDLEFGVLKNIFQIKSFGSLEHKDEDFLVHLAAHKSETRQLSLRTASCLSAQEGLVILAVSGDEISWYSHLQEGLLKAAHDCKTLTKHLHVDKFHKPSPYLALALRTRRLRTQVR